MSVASFVKKPVWAVGTAADGWGILAGPKSHAGGQRRDRPCQGERQRWWRWRGAAPRVQPHRGTRSTCVAPQRGEPWTLRGAPRQGVRRVTIRRTSPGGSNRLHVVDGASRDQTVRAPPGAPGRAMGATHQDLRAVAPSWRAESGRLRPRRARERRQLSRVAEGLRRTATSSGRHPNPGNDCRLYTPPKHGTPGRTRTPSAGFGERCSTNSATGA